MEAYARPGIVRYTLTKHFQEQGLVPNWWFSAIDSVLERAVARATGKVRLPSEQSSMDYLGAYMQSQGIKEMDPTEGYSDVVPPEFKLDRPTMDWQIENYRQENHPLKSKRWFLLRRIILKRDNNTCLCCGAKDTVMHVDHIKPRAKYPALIWEPTNLQTLCKPCNMAKRINETDYRQHGRAA